nr:phosphoglucan, water dikinase, chloroplastic [Ipomoea batatas]
MRRALTSGSSLKGVWLGNEWGRSSFWWENDGALRRTEICFLGLPNGNHTAKISIFSSLPLPFLRKSIHPVLAAAASAVSSPTLDTQEQFESEEMDSAYGLETVHVKFQLQKECSFGQQFLMVGDDPIFGAWDPSKAVPLTWSEGHVWTLEMDIPTGKSIVYKFLLKEADKDIILWQPGPDRVVETWETSNTITVCEDWDNAELQNIIEGGVLDGEAEESAIYAGMLIAEKSSGNEHGSLVADNISRACTGNSDCGQGQDNISRVEKEVNAGNASEAADLVFDEETPVLVPGLNQIFGVESELEPLEEDETESEGEGLVGSINAPELNANEEFLSGKETSEMVFSKQPSELSVVESDLQWGRTTLHKLLTNLGWI